MKRICVFCGSSPGEGLDYLQAAEQLGYLLASRNIGLVYGGGKVGTMGKIAESVLKKGGEVTGVIPKALVDREVAFTRLTDLRVVRVIHGYGTGQLKRALTGFLEQHPLVARLATAPPDQGGGGVTVVELKE